MSTNILFICDHSAGKSLLAATYVRAAAARRGLELSIDIAGPDPDPAPMPNVVAAIEAQGFRVDWQPQLVDVSHTMWAERIVSVGCDPALIPTDDPIESWDVPMLSQDFDGSMRGIHARAEALVERLSTAQS